jgi:molybdate-binding protein/DNA-binding XRE family transcriptional regulator
VAGRLPVAPEGVQGLKQDTGLQNSLKATRLRLGISQQQLAQASRVSRQTIGGIEAGLYAPSAAVALRLAKALGCRMEELFWLEEDLPTVEAAAASAALAVETPLRVALAQVGGRWVAHPLLGEQAFRTEMIPADGTGVRQANGETMAVRLLDDPESLSRTAVVAGCTPVLSLWARSAERWHPGLRVLWTHANSMAALYSLARGEVHAAGLHLCDPATGEYNMPYVRQVLGDRPVTLVSLGVWEEGLIVAPANPRRIREAADLAREDVLLVNREEGAGARLLLESFLRQEGVAPEAVRGFAHEVHSHQDVARAVLSGQADVGVSTAAVASVYGLAFIPIRQVRYDLALLTEYMAQEPVRQLLGTLHHRWVRSQLQVLGGYDTARTGEVVEEG